MRKPLGTTHRFMCALFALTVIAALYSIGSLVYSSDPDIAQKYDVLPAVEASNNTASTADAWPLPILIANKTVFSANHESSNEDHAMEESRTADDQAELADIEESVVSEFDPDQPPVTADNVNAEPTGEFAEQIRAGEMKDLPFEGEAYGFDPDMEQPDLDNASVEPKLEFADQIRQGDIGNTAALSGYEADHESYVALKEVDDSSAPPTATGASIDPDEQALFEHTR